MTEKIDLVKNWKHLYAPAVAQPVLVEVPPLNYLMIDGHGDPNSAPAYQEAVTALFSLAYAIKFGYKKATGVDFAVMPAEGLWWVADMARFSVEDKSDWDWTMMILQPEFIRPEQVTELQAEVIKKKGLPGLDRVRFETYQEGTSAQLMHIGPYAAEGPNVARLHDFIAQHGYVRQGKHHEIYLSDFRRTAPERLKTVIRQPVAKP